MKQRGRCERRHRLPRLHGGKLALLIACLIQTALSIVCFVLLGHVRGMLVTQMCIRDRPLSMFLSSINAGEIGIAFAAAVIYMIPGLLLFLHGEAYLVEGIAHSGSVKG